MGAHSTDLAGATNTALNLTGVALSAAGNYTVIVSNSVGSVTSQVAVLTVMPARPTITTQPESVTVREGTNVNFTVIASSSTPLLYQWVFNSTGLPGATNSTLDLTNVVVGDGGNYTVIVGNSGGSVTSLVAVLTVLAISPVITTQPVSLTVFEGTNVTFTVAATGTAPLTYRWARNTTPISNATNAALSLSNVALSASGNYTVTVSNSAGSVSSEVALLTVLPAPPVITVRLNG